MEPLSKITAARRRRERRFADLVTRFSGTISFVLLHVLWFAAWIVFNLVSPHPFDKFPFGLLTLIVSLEAIFLSTFVLMSQNEASARDEEREVIDHRTDLLSEAWTEMIGERLGINPDDVRKRYEDRVRQEAQSSAAQQRS
jgi:uncharacterized membrane protein